ncbi:hypothetical protein PsorP6_014939 [Peronosclerospora sorghi]|uniref:Uncharacterized protein n=1 Tax=Peronosclerospora sorghi TaxID=230839 RepID=A0ACC0VSU8_9STRA|nr:hypothetical protein PsorP6_014939 [Peronosclerospora sorghi]
MKTRPSDPMLEKQNYHPDVTKRLTNLSQSSNLPHLLVYGRPSGAGKTTRIMALLRVLYGDGALKVRLEHKSFKVPRRSTKVDSTTGASNFHIEMNESFGQVLKEIAQYHLADSNAQNPFNVVLLVDVDHLSKHAQHALRRTMEKYTATCRLVLCCNNPSKVIDPLRSRCLRVRVAIKSERNLRRALLMLETCRVQQWVFKDVYSYLLYLLLMFAALGIRYRLNNKQIQLPAWEEYICTLAKIVLQEQSPAGYVESNERAVEMIVLISATLAREMIYELMSNCVPSEVILNVLCRELMSRLDDDLKHELVQWASYYEHRMQRGSNDIFHFEAVLAKFMMLYKTFLLDLYM